MAVFAALRQAKNVKAKELQLEGYKIAQHRSLCEVVRRVPVTLDALGECWGFGGSGVRLQKYGDYFLVMMATGFERCRIPAVGNR